MKLRHPRRFSFALPARFTLIELLVVIAIISILASMLFPVLGQARDKARHTACMNNVKQINMGFMGYADTNDGWILPTDSKRGRVGSFDSFKGADGLKVPWSTMAKDELGLPNIPTSYWTVLPETYRKSSILICPSMIKPTKYSWEVNYGIPVYYMGGQNWGSMLPPAKLHQLTRPSDSINFQDSDDGTDNYSGAYFVTNNRNSALYNRHNLTSSVGFADGHVGIWRWPSDVQPDPTWLTQTPWGWPQ